MSKIVIGVLILAVLGSAMFFVARRAFAGAESVAGRVNGALRDCPSSPNCVSSQDAREEAMVPPFPMHSPPSRTTHHLKQAVRSMGGRLSIEDGPYLHFEFRSRLFGFVDDVEFLLDEQLGAVQVRSASRTGHSDLGVNRKRIELLRDAYEGLKDNSN